MRVTLNGSWREVPPGATVADAVVLSGSGPLEHGVAVAIDGRVVPRERWGDTPVAEGARLEVVRAAAGG